MVGDLRGLRRGARVGVESVCVCVRARGNLDPVVSQTQISGGPASGLSARRVARGFATDELLFATRLLRYLTLLHLSSIHLARLHAPHPLHHVQRILLAAARSLDVGRFQLELEQPEPLHPPRSTLVPLDKAARLDETRSSRRRQQDQVSEPMAFVPGTHGDGATACALLAS